MSNLFDHFGSKNQLGLKKLRVSKIFITQGWEKVARNANNVNISIMKIL